MHNAKSLEPLVSPTKRHWVKSSWGSWADALRITHAFWANWKQDIIFWVVWSQRRVGGHQGTGDKRHRMKEKLIGQWQTNKTDKLSPEQTYRGWNVQEKLIALALRKMTAIIKGCHKYICCLVPFTRSALWHTGGSMQSFPYDFYNHSFGSPSSVSSCLSSFSSSSGPISRPSASHDCAWSQQNKYDFQFDQRQ
jgi:hypothetical protein